MPPHKCLCVNWKKPFILIDEESTYDEIQPTEKTFPHLILSAAQKTYELTKRNQIFPQIKIVGSLMEPKKFINFPMSFIRFYQSLQAPKKNLYQLSQEDYQFLKLMQHQFSIQGQSFFNEQFMQQIIIFLEKETKLKDQPTLKKNWLLAFIKKKQKNRLESKHLKKIQSLLLGYWKQKRSICNFPLYRPLWKKLNKDNLLFVYRPRAKKQIVKLTAVDEQCMARQLCKQVEYTSKNCQQTLVEQLQKLKNIKSYVHDFYKDATEFISQQEINKLVMNGQHQSQTYTKKNIKRILQTNQIIQEKQKENNIETKDSTSDRYQPVSILLTPMISQIQKSGIDFGSIISSTIFEDNMKISSRPNFEQRIEQKCNNLLETLFCFISESKQTEQLQTGQTQVLK